MARKKKSRLQKRLFGGPPSPEREKVEEWLVSEPPEPEPKPVRKKRHPKEKPIEEFGAEIPPEPEHLERYRKRKRLRQAQLRRERGPAGKSLEEFGAEIPPEPEHLEWYRKRKRLRQARLDTERELTELTRQGKAKREMLDIGARYEVYEIIGSRGKGIAKKKRIPTRFKGQEEYEFFYPQGNYPPEYYDKLIDVKSRRMSEARYRKGVRKAKEAVRRHKHSEEVLKGRVPELYGVQMRVDRPGFFVLQEKLPVFLSTPELEERKLRTPKGRKITVSKVVNAIPMDPYSLEAFLPEIFSQIVVASKSKYPIDAHLGNWMVIKPPNRTIEDVVKEYQETGSRNFAVAYCDTLHKEKREYLSLKSTLPRFLHQLKTLYPEKHRRFKQIALEIVRHDMGPRSVPAVKRYIHKYEMRFKMRKPQSPETDKKRMQTLAGKVRRARGRRRIGMG